MLDWADGGATTAENLILLCRFHHGRIHTSGWTITKTAPGQALIVHHDSHNGHDDTDPDLRCGCADWRTDADLDLDFQTDAANVFPTGLYPEEWGPGIKEDLNATAEQIEQAQIEADLNAAQARVRARFAATATAQAATSEDETATAGEGEPASPPGQTTRTPAGVTDATGPEDPIPFLGCPPRDAAAGNEHHTGAQLEPHQGSSPPPYPGTTRLQPRPTPTPTNHPSTLPAPHRRLA